MEIHDSRPVDYRWHIMMNDDDAVIYLQSAAFMFLCYSLIPRPEQYTITCPCICVQQPRCLQFTFGCNCRQKDLTNFSVSRINWSESLRCTRHVPLFRSLLWQPVKFRKELKLYLLASKTFSGIQPVYLQTIRAIKV